MVIAARAGARTVKLSKVRAAYSLGASKSQVLRRVIFPNALPELFTGVRVVMDVVMRFAESKLIPWRGKG